MTEAWPPVPPDPQLGAADAATADFAERAVSLAF